MLRYVSTRGQAPGMSFSGATLAGLAPDGGLYVPDACPKLSAQEIANMRSQHYLEIAARVIMPFVGDDIPPADLIRMLQKAYQSFDAKDIVPIHALAEDFYLLELFHGPTLAFKDVALQFLGQVFDYILARRKQRVTIVGATSGDTGSAAIEAFQGKDNVDIFILHPKGRVSEVQRRQMTSVAAKNVHNIAIEGSFDDCQDIVKALFADEAFRNDMGLSAVNSINWARILAQVVYYVYAGARIGKPVSFCVPTGNFGNIYAGYVAKSMGLEVGKLIAATNRNDILHRFFETGRMQRGGVAATISPSMDIQVSSNFERLLFDMLARKGEAVHQTMRHFKDVGPFNVDADIMSRVREVFASGRLDDGETKAVIRRVYEAQGYILDPHSAIGVGVAQEFQRRNPGHVMVALATAHPAKFPDAVESAIGIRPELPPRLAHIMTLPERCETLPADAKRVKGFVRRNAGA